MAGQKERGGTSRFLLLEQRDSGKTGEGGEGDTVAEECLLIVNKEMD